MPQSWKKSQASASTRSSPALVGVFMWLLVFRAHPFAAVALLGAAESYVQPAQGHSRSSCYCCSCCRQLIWHLPCLCQRSCLQAGAECARGRWHICRGLLVGCVWSSAGTSDCDLCESWRLALASTCFVNLVAPTVIPCRHAAHLPEAVETFYKR